MPTPISRSEAQAAGLTHYYTHKSCKHGHLSRRYVANGQCVICARANALNYRNRDRQNYNSKMRTYRKGNPQLRKREQLRAKMYAPLFKKQHQIRLKKVSENPFMPENSLFLARRMVHGSRSRAKQRKVLHTIYAQDILPLPSHCPILGVELSYGQISHRGRSCHASLDEIIVGEGYVPGNVAIISIRANTLKSNITLSEIAQLYKYIERKPDD